MLLTGLVDLLVGLGGLGGPVDLVGPVDLAGPVSEGFLSPHFIRGVDNLPAGLLGPIVPVVVVGPPFALGLLLPGRLGPSPAFLDFGARGSQRFLWVTKWFRSTLFWRGCYNSPL